MIPSDRFCPRDYYSGLSLEQVSAIEGIHQREFAFFLRGGHVKRGLFFSNARDLLLAIRGEPNLLSFHHSISRFRNPWETLNSMKSICWREVVLDFDLEGPATFRRLSDLLERVRGTLRVCLACFPSLGEPRIFFSGSKGFHVFFPLSKAVTRALVLTLTHLLSSFSKEVLSGPESFERHRWALEEILGVPPRSLSLEAYLEIEASEKLVPVDLSVILDENKLIKAVPSLNRKTGFSPKEFPFSGSKVDPSDFLECIPQDGMREVPATLTSPFDLSSMGLPGELPAGRAMVKSFLLSYLNLE